MKKNDEILISFIMAVYNNTTYVIDAIESVVLQDYSNCEMIVVDDGSTDGTAELLDEIAQKHERIKVIHQTNQWIYASINNGIQVADGEYIYVVNSDDKIRDGALRVLKDAIKTYDHPDLIWTKVVVNDPDETELTEPVIYGNDPYYIDENRYYSDKSLVRDAWPLFFRSSLAINQANLYKRSIALRHKFRNDYYGADALFNIQIASDIESAVVLKQPIYDFFIYDSKSLNASQGKYYGYEHEMFNEIYNGYNDLFYEWGLKSEKYVDCLGAWRLRNLTYEIRIMKYEQCELSLDEKIKKILVEDMDSCIISCAENSKRRLELESRVLNGIASLIGDSVICSNTAFSFVIPLLRWLPRRDYEVPNNDEVDYSIIMRAINHPLNPAKIGRAIFFSTYGEGF